ncbi:MAG: hypothetical protein OXL38_11000 [Gammaproteobacteria bacterium]|nr:hypothetical protein [Gammaproteobacteria bacterium]
MATPTSTAFAEREEAAYTSFTALRGRLLGEKGGEFQRDFLTAAKKPEAFVEFMDAEVTAVDGKAIKTMPKPLTEQSFKEMTSDQEESAYELWRAVPPRVACRASFWAEVTLQHIREGVIEDAYWLAANGGRNESGDERIDRALADLEDGRKTMDDCVRTILRRMSGLPTARGNRSVFSDGSFGRAWWRGRLVARIAERCGAEPKPALSAVVRTNQEYWENLVMMIVSRGSVLGAIVVQDAFVNGLAKHLRSTPRSPLRNANSLRVALRRLSNLAAARELGVLTFTELGELVTTLLDRVADSLTT